MNRKHVWIVEQLEEDEQETRVEQLEEDEQKTRVVQLEEDEQETRVDCGTAGRR